MGPAEHSWSPPCTIPSQSPRPSGLWGGGQGLPASLTQPAATRLPQRAWGDEIGTQHSPAGGSDHPTCWRDSRTHEGLQGCSGPAVQGFPARPHPAHVGPAASQAQVGRRTCMGGRCRRRRRRSRRRQQPVTAVPPARLLGIYVCVSAPLCSVTCRGTGKEEEAAAAALAAAAAEAAVSAWVEQHREWWHECCCALPLHVIHCAAGGPSCLAQGAVCGPAHVGRAAHRPAVGTRLDSPAYLLAWLTACMPGTASLALHMQIHLQSPHTRAPPTAHS